MSLTLTSQSIPRRLVALAGMSLAGAFVIALPLSAAAAPLAVAIRYNSDDATDIALVGATNDAKIQIAMAWPSRDSFMAEYINVAVDSQYNFPYWASLPGVQAVSGPIPGRPTTAGPRLRSKCFRTHRKPSSSIAHTTAS